MFAPVSRAALTRPDSYRARRWGRHATAVYFSPVGAPRAYAVAVLSHAVIETAPPGDAVTSDQRDKVEAYFRADGPDWVLKVLIFGGCAFVVLLAAAAAGLPRSLLAYPALFGSTVFIYAALVEVYAIKREALVDAVTTADLARVAELAFDHLQLAKLDLRDAKCCAFLGQYVENGENYGNALKRTKLGKDERTRWTPREVASVWVGQDRLWIHWCAIDLTTGATLYERMREIVYGDVVSVVLFGKTTTRPMPAKYRKAVKASRYWSTHGGVVREDLLQIPGAQNLSLALASGGTVPLADWEGSRDSVEPADAVANREAALRLRAWVEDAKRERLQRASAGALPRVTSGYGQS